MSAWRIACAFAPDFVLQVALRGLPQDEREAPVVLVETDERARVRAANAPAAAAGARLGQTAARARAVVPGLHCLPWDPAALGAAVRRVADAFYQASPMVVPDDALPGAFWLDARGMRWLGGEPALARRLIDLAAAEGFVGLQVGLADTAVTARAAALSAAIDDRIQIIPPGKDAGFLGRLPIEALAIDPDVRDTLRALGLRTVAELRALPEAALLTRFGPAGREALDLALGRDARRPEGRPAPALPEVTLCLDAPVAESGSLVFGLRGLAESLAARLIAGGLSTTRLALILRLDDHREVSTELIPARPLHHPHLLFELVRDRLERGATADLSSPVVEVRLAAREVQPAVAEQAHLGAARWNPSALAGALDRLHGRYGQPVVFEPEPRDDARPEAAAVWRPVVEAALHAPPEQTEAAAPIAEPAPVRRWLSVPQRVDVRFDRDRCPQAVRWGGGWRTVDARGPERLSGAWWTADPYAREDYRLALADGGVLWVSHDAREGTWWLLGWLD